ncbi:hypothetical protein AKO1_010666 [Acrasis kona]|uniref:Major facilitator superfamily (MFS) profile domain-containing protein n=1 Tax=Acrasis kona TaxID=1008807 RepID=A0AAW2ZJS0_9EUKA
MYFVEGMTFTIVFPIINEILSHCHVTRWVGAAEFVLLFCYIPPQILSGYVHGAVANRFDHKKIVFVESILLSMILLAHGYTSSYPLFILLRMICGFLNGMVSTAKEFAAKSTEPKRRQYVYAFFGFAWGIGSLVGIWCGFTLSGKRLTSNPSDFLVLNPFFFSFVSCAVLVLLISILYYATTAFYIGSGDVDPQHSNKPSTLQNLKNSWADIKSKNLMIVSTPWQHYRMMQYVLLFLLRVHFVGSFADAEVVAL